jgi:transposase
VGGAGGGSERRYLTTAQERAIRAALASGLTQREAADAAGISYARLLCRLADQLADLKTGRGWGRKRRTDDPTDAEIAWRIAEVQAGWTEETRREKWNPTWRPSPDFADPADGG